MISVSSNIRNDKRAHGDTDRAPLCRFRLETPLDRYLLKDPRVWHAASAIQPVDAARPAARGILTLDYHFAP